jgi:hypothetical protein
VASISAGPQKEGINLPALRTHTELLERCKLGSLSDSLNNLGLVLELARLGRYQTQDNPLLAVLGQEPQRLQATASLVIPLEQKVVNLEVPEEDLGDGLVSARRKVSGTEVSTAQVDRGGHVGGLETEGLVDELDVLSGEFIDILASFLGGVSHLLGAEVGQVGVVELNVLASGFGESGNLLLVCLGEVGVEVGEIGVVFVVDSGSATAKGQKRKLL